MKRWVAQWRPCCCWPRGGLRIRRSGDGSSGAATKTLTVYAAASLDPTFDGDRQAVRGRPRGCDGQVQLRRLLRPGRPDPAGRSGRRLRLGRHREHGQGDGRRPRRGRAGRTSRRTPWRSRCRRTTRPGWRPSRTSRSRAPRSSCVRPQVPCGAAAQKVEEAAGVDIKPVSEEQSVTDVLNKVTTGEADAGLVYVTDVQGRRRQGQGHQFPESSSAVNTYPIGALADSKNKELAQGVRRPRHRGRRAADPG